MVMGFFYAFNNYKSNGTEWMQKKKKIKIFVGIKENTIKDSLTFFVYY